MAKFGFQILDLKNFPLPMSDEYIEGVYKTLEGANGKPLYITGVVYKDTSGDDPVLVPLPAQVATYNKNNDGDYCIKIDLIDATSYFNFFIVVSENDDIHITPAE